MKSCSNPNCKQINPQPLTEFYKAKGCKDGRRNACRHCRIEITRQSVEKRKDEVAKYQRNYRIENKDKLTTYRSNYGPKYYQENKEKISAYQAAYRLEKKEEFNARIANWGKNNPGKRNSITARYRASKLRATVPWLTKNEWKEIKNLYIEAAKITRETGIPHHVDHIVPLQGETVSGLHVPWNLQILVGPGPEGNLAKGNRF